MMCDTFIVVFIRYLYFAVLAYCQLQLHLLKLSNGLFVIPDFRLEILQLRLLRINDSLADLCLEVLRLHELLLLAKLSTALLQLLLRLFDLSVNVNAALDLEEDSSICRDDEDRTAGGHGRIGWKNGQVCEAFPGEGTDRLRRVRRCLVCCSVEAMDVR